MDYLKRSEELFEETVENRRHLHQMPELGLELPETTAFIMEKLTEMGYDPKPCGGGVVACVGKMGGKTVLLRGDVDALPMKEESGLPFASQRENAHTCGHDIHGAMLLTAAKMLKENEAALDGMVKLMFQPGEEPLTGARSMIADGLLQDPRPDVALGYHVVAGSMPMGLFVYNREGTLMNSSDNFIIDIQGKGGHGAYPDACIDPINIAAHMILALESVVAREIKSTQASVLTIGKVTAGDAPNIIPDQAQLQGTLRCDSEKEREFILQRLSEVVDAVAKMYRGSATITMLAGTPPLICDPQSVDDFVGYMRELDVPGQCEHVGMHAASSEDFSAVLSEIPGAYMFLSAGFTDGRETYNQHHPKVEFNEEVMKSGAAYLAHCATRWLEEHK
ncbi:amidohydrolase [Lachnospiraceae bacterium AM23-2LB]|nr:amidohydrolase [Lachnospiraceae bacterium AM23-2LB]RJW03350.1 amidohydrolase [Lachnospiraceae bacterium AM40-2BH]